MIFVPMFALATALSAPGTDMAAASQNSRAMLPGEVAAHADVFLPSLGADHVVTLRVDRGWGAPGSDTHVVTRRGDWVRMDLVREGPPSIRYLRLAVGIEVSLSRNPAGGYSDVRIETRPDSRPGRADYGSFKTGETDVVLGEPCEVWNIYRSRPNETGRGGFARLGCVTPDGIELWRRTVGTAGDIRSSAEAVHVERRSVEIGEVRPPNDLLNLERWFGVGAAARDAVPADKPDFELVLAHDGNSGEAAITVRRRHPWHYDDRYDEGGPRRVSVRREDRVTWLQIDVGPPGSDQRLSMSNRPSDARDQLWDPPVPLPSKPPQTLLGERCTWIDVRPNVLDLEHHECRTEDGIPLRIWLWSRGGAASYSAISLRRRPIEFSEVMPPRELLERSLWRLSE
jgi:hypothetical protein